MENWKRKKKKKKKTMQLSNRGKLTERKKKEIISETKKSRTKIEKKGEKEKN